MNQHEDHKEPHRCTVRDQDRVLQGKVALGQGVLCGRQAALRRKRECDAAASAPRTAPARTAPARTAPPAFSGEAGRRSPHRGLKEAPTADTSGAEKEVGFPHPPRDAQRGTEMQSSGHRGAGVRGCFSCLLMLTRALCRLGTHASGLSAACLFYLFFVALFAMWVTVGNVFLGQHEVFPVFLWSTSPWHESVRHRMRQPEGKRKARQRQVVPG